MEYIKHKFQAGRRIIIIGDIHGDYDNMVALLNKLNYQEDDDILITVGDMVDRGPESVKVFDYFHSHRNRMSVIGNHEDMILHAQENPLAIGNWMANGGHWSTEVTPEKLAEIASQADKLPFVIELELDSEELVGIVHAQVPSAFNDWDEFKNMANHYAGARNRAIWDRERARGKCPIVTGVDLVVSGHTVLNSHELRGNHLFLDTGSVFRNDTNNFKLTALVLDPDTPLKNMRVVCQ